MPSVDVPVALLGYGTVGAAVHRLLEEQGEEIERATGHRLRVVRALVRDPAKERDFAPAPGVLTTDPSEVLGDASIAIVAEVMGGVEPAGSHVLALLGSGRSVVTANKQLVARRGAELFAAAGLEDVTESTLAVSSTYTGFDELWSGFLEGIGPAGAFCVSLGERQRERLRGELFARVGSPTGSFTLPAAARSATARVPTARSCTSG